MATKKDILEILGLISVAYPNFKMAQTGGVSTADAYLAFLGDLPSDLLKAAVLKTCAEAGRAFAPTVGEIRGAVAALHSKANRIPSTIEAWEETSTAHYREVSEEKPFYRGGERYTTDPDAHQWSHPLVKKVALSLGWPEFPGENESTDRAHFFKQYDLEVMHYSEREIELPDVQHYIENRQIKQLAEGMTK